MAANYTASALAAAQIAYSEQFNAPELRRKQNPALMLGIQNQDAVFGGAANVNELKKKDTMPVKAYIRTKRAASASAAKSVNHGGTRADSLEIVLNWITIVEPFKIYLKQAQNNVFKYAQMLQHEITESARNIHDRAGTLGLSYLQSHRSQLAAPATAGAGAWSGVNFALEVAAGDANYFYQMVASFMRKQNHRTGLDVIADSIAYRKAEYIQNQGGGNSTNLGFQIGGQNIIETTETIDANYNKGAVLAMPQGVFAALPWNDPTNLQIKGNYDSTLGGFGTVVDPLGSGLVYDFHAYTQAIDASADGGGVQDEVLQGELALNLCWVLTPLSTANESPVWELAQM